MLESEAVRLAAVLTSLVGLGLVTGTSPTMYAMVLRLLGRDATTPTPLIALVGGFAAGTMLLVLLLQVVDPRSIEFALEGDVEREVVRRGVDLVAGSALLLGGLVVLVRSRRQAARPARPAVPERPRRLVLTGLLDGLFSLSSIAPVYVMARTVRSVSADDVVRLVGLVVFMLALVAPYLLLGWAWRRAPRLTGRLNRLGDRVGATDVRPLAGAALVVVGASFLAFGLWFDPS